MLHLTIYDVKDDRISNEEVRRRMGIYPMETILGLRRARWIEKLANMESTRSPRRILHAWMPQARPTGKPNQTTRKALADELRTLGTTSELKTFIPLARDKNSWGEMVEWNLGLAQGTYTKYSRRGRSTGGSGSNQSGTNGGNQTAAPTSDAFVYEPFGTHFYMNYEEAHDHHARNHGFDNAEHMWQTRVYRMINGHS